jgi:hypothetical protein
VKTTYIALALCVVATLSTAAACGGSSKKEPTQAGPVISIAPVTGVKAGADFVVSVRIDNVVNLGGYQFNLDYDQTKISVVSEDDGVFLGSTGRQPICQNRNTAGSLVYACATKEPQATQGSTTQTAPTAGPSGAGELVKIHLKVAAGVSGPVELQLGGVNVVDPLAATIQATGAGTTVTVQ